MNKFIKNSVLIVLPGEDFSEQEYLSVKNSLIEAGFSIFIASDAPVACKGMKGLIVQPDVSFFNMKESNFSAVVFIGGTGVVKYFKNINLLGIARKFNSQGKLICAICGATVILGNAGILNGINATCFPELKEELIRQNANYLADRVVIDKNIITSPDPSAAIEFGQAIVERLKKL